MSNVPEAMDVDEGPIRSRTVFVIDDDDDDVIQITDPYVATANPNNSQNTRRRPTTHAETSSLARELFQRTQPARQPQNDSRQQEQNRHRNFVTASHYETDPEVIYVTTVSNPTNISQNTRRRPTTHAEVSSLTRGLRGLFPRTGPTRQPQNESRQSEGATRQSDHRGNQATEPRSPQRPYRNEASYSPKRLGDNLNTIQNPIPAGTEVYLVGASLYREVMGSRAGANTDVIVLDDD